MTADRSHGPLHVFLVCLTVVTGLVDAFSYLSLGHVFVANMTGNVVLAERGNARIEEVTASHASMVSQPEAVTQLILSRRGDEQQPDVRLCDSHPTMRRPCHRASILRSPVMTVRPQDLAGKLPLVSHVHDQRAEPWQS